jgi:hypothetical protein
MATVDELIDEILDSTDGEFVTMTLAEELVKRLNRKQPELLRAWLLERAAKIMKVAIDDRIRSQRTKSRRQMKAGAFADAAERYANGDEEAFDQIVSPFTTLYVVGVDETGKGIRRSVAEMTGPDHQHVSDTYQSSGKRDLMLAAFHRTVARQLGKKRTADVMDEQKYQHLYESTYRRLMGAEDGVAEAA